MNNRKQNVLSRLMHDMIGHRFGFFLRTVRLDDDGPHPKTRIPQTVGEIIPELPDMAVSLKCGFVGALGPGQSRGLRHRDDARAPGSENPEKLRDPLSVIVDMLENAAAEDAVHRVGGQPDVADVAEYVRRLVAVHHEVTDVRIPPEEYPDRFLSCIYQQSSNGMFQGVRLSAEFFCF